MEDGRLMWYLPPPPPHPPRLAHFLLGFIQGVLVQRLCEGVLNRAEAGNTSVAKEGFDKVAGPVWERLRGLLHAVGGLDG